MAVTKQRILARAEAAALERETRLIREAVAMVAGGASRRVVVAGIRHGAALLDAGRQMGLAAGVRVNPIGAGAEAAVDIVVEPIYE